MWSGGGSNSRPLHCEREHSPTELPPQPSLHFTGCESSKQPGPHRAPGFFTSFSPMTFRTRRETARKYRPKKDEGLPKKIRTLGTGGKSGTSHPGHRVEQQAEKSGVPEVRGGAQPGVKRPAIAALQPSHRRGGGITLTQQNRRVARQAVRFGHRDANQRLDPLEHQMPAGRRAPISMRTGRSRPFREPLAARAAAAESIQAGST